MKACIPVTADGQVGGGFGRAERVALANVQAEAITDFELHEVRWNVLHDEDGEGRHHARIARFLIDHGVEVVVASHMGEPMERMLEKLGLTVRLGAAGDARRALLSVG